MTTNNRRRPPPLSAEVSRQAMVRLNPTEALAFGDNSVSSGKTSDVEDDSIGNVERVRPVLAEQRTQTGTFGC